MGERQMTRWVSRGKCSLCGGVFSKAAMAKHMESCIQRKAVSEAPSSGRRSQKTKILHLMVEGRGLSGYWMHLEALANATLEDLDGFLRDTWLECCGHMSAFTIGKARHVAGGGVDSMWVGLGMVSGGGSMDVALGEVLRVGMKFYHEYDFGTTTELALEVVSEREGEIRGKPIQLLARNDPPPITCESCGEIATQVCSQCIWSGKGWLCDGCAGKHKCGEDMLLPVVNSPRVGMCGYTGED